MSHPPRTEPVEACPVCGSGLTHLMTLPDRLHGVPGEHRYARCDRCRAVVQAPRVVAEDLPLLYPGDYYTLSDSAPGERPARAPDLPGIRGWIRSSVQRAVAAAPGDERVSGPGRLLARSRWLRERAFGDQVIDEMLPWRRPQGRALDVGCGDGELLGQLAAVGWAAQGLEWDPRAAEVARARGETVHVGSAEDLSSVPGPFELITLVHVFEHLADPVAALRSLGGHLAEGGRIVLVYPNPSSLLPRIYGSDWFSWDPPRHLTLLPAGSLRLAAQRSGLSVRSLRSLARWTAGVAWQSRAVRRRFPGNLTVSHPGLYDRGLALAARLGAAAGLLWGEELVAVVARTGQ